MCSIGHRMFLCFFQKTMFGFYHVDFSKKCFLTIVDFTKPAQQRFFVIALKQPQVLYKTWVVRSRNSGNLMYNTSFLT